MKNKKRRKEFYDTQMIPLHVGVYDVDVFVLINMSGKEFFKKMKPRVKNQGTEQLKKICDDWDSDYDNGVSQGRMFTLMGGFVVFLNVRKGFFRTAIGTLVHELTHVTHYLLRHRRIPLTEDTEEAHTYLVQYLTTEALRRMY